MDIDFLVIIPARGGSKGIPRKNLKKLLGIPLIQHTIDIAKKISAIDKIVVSTDDSEIEEVAQQLGAEVIIRPAELSGDKSLVKDAIIHTVKKLEENGDRIKYILLLEATSPLRQISDIEECILKLSNSLADSVATFSESCISPGRLWRIDENNIDTYIEGSNPWLPRQQQPKAYELNGLVYGFTREALSIYENEVPILVGNIIPVITQNHVVDIDNEVDFIIVEKIMENKNEKVK